jgi:hypothetical protein
MLGASGNSWLRLISVAAVDTKRSRRTEDRASYAEAALRALGRMRSYSGIPNRRWALVIKVRVDWALLSHRSKNVPKCPGCMKSCWSGWLFLGWASLSSSEGPSIVLTDGSFLVTARLDGSLVGTSRAIEPTCN